MFGDDILYMIGDGALWIFGLEIGDLMGDNLGGVEGWRSRTAGERSLLVGDDCRLSGERSLLVGEDGLLLDGERSLLVGDDGLRFGDGALLNGEVALAVGEGILIGDDTGCGFTMRIGLLGDNVGDNANASNICESVLKYGSLLGDNGLRSRGLKLLGMPFVCPRIWNLGLTLGDGKGLTRGVPGVNVSELAAELIVVELWSRAVWNVSVASDPDIKIWDSCKKSFSSSLEYSQVSPISLDSNDNFRELESPICIDGTQESWSWSVSVSVDAIGASFCFGGAK